MNLLWTDSRSLCIMKATNGSTGIIYGRRTAVREIIDLNTGWYFHKGDVKNELPTYKGFCYISAKTERYHIGPASKDYYASSDSFNLNREHKSERWEKVEVPHDYVIEGIPDKKYKCVLLTKWKNYRAIYCRKRK